MRVCGKERNVVKGKKKRRKSESRAAMPYDARQSNSEKYPRSRDENEGK
jgi:hypothetical protein